MEPQVNKVDETKNAIALKPGPVRTRGIDGDTALIFLRDYGMIVAFALLFVVLSVTTPAFLSIDNFRNVVEQNAYIGIAACGATLVIIGGGFDLSQGTVYALSGALAAWLAIRVDPVLGLIGGAAAGLILGAFNGFLVSVLKIHSFLATLATGFVFSGLALWITGGFLISVSKSASFVWLGRGELIPTVPNPITLFALVAITLELVLAKTNYGRYIFAAGGNPEAARLSGVAVGRVIAGTFVVSAFAASISGLIAASQAGTGQAAPGGTDTLALTAIAAVVIGGTSINGGSGAIWRTVLGVLFLAMINNAFNLSSLSPDLQSIFTGAIIVIAVALNSLAARR
jgi:ribose transport system permease protein